MTNQLALLGSGQEVQLIFCCGYSLNTAFAHLAENRVNTCMSVLHIIDRVRGGLLNSQAQIELHLGVSLSLIKEETRGIYRHLVQQVAELDGLAGTLGHTNDFAVAHQIGTKGEHVDRALGEVFFRGQFSSFDADGFSRGFSYGDHFVIGGTLNEKFSAFGVDYLTNSARDTTVNSRNIGKEVYTGYILHLGNFAVVDHGMGIATWYCHLSSSDCAVGDVLSKGEAVGKCGNSVFLEGSGTLLLCSLSGQFIDPDLISGKELLENKTQVSGGNNNDVQ